MTNVLELLKEKLQDDALVVEAEDEENYTLRLSLDAMGRKDDGVVLLEIARVPMDENPEVGYFHFFAALSAGVSREKQQTVLPLINRLNTETLLGSYGILWDEGILFYKYVLKVFLKNEKEALDFMYDSLAEILAIIDSDYDQVAELLA